MCFMFTKFVTKVLGSRRRIAALLGYTGGESLEQISISEQIKSLPIQPYSLWSSKEGPAEIWGEEEIVKTLLEELKKEPTLSIENLPHYRRPYLLSLPAEMENVPLRMKISDLLELGFDPTKLKEFNHDGVDYIFERISPHFLPSIEKRRILLPKIAEAISENHFSQTAVQINPPAAIFRDRGNVYVLRRKVEGIHMEEALDQLKTAPNLKEMNRALMMDRVIVSTIHGIVEEFRKIFDKRLHEEIENLTFFIPWDIKGNIPRMNVDITGVSLSTVWAA